MSDLDTRVAVAENEALNLKERVAKLEKNQTLLVTVVFTAIVGAVMDFFSKGGQ